METNNNQLYLSIIVPAYNEEKKIGKDLEMIYGYFNTQKYTFEVIVVNDGSKDNTVQKVEEFKKNNPNVKLISYQLNQGKGHAVKTGVLESKGKYVFFVDAGYCVPFKEIEKGINTLNEGNHIALGSRHLKESNIVVKQPYYRTLAGRIFNKIVKIFIGLHGIKDTQCGFKLFEGSCARDLFKRQKIKGFTFDTEILVYAKKLGYKIKEFPVQWACDMDTKLKPWSHTLKIIMEIIKIRFSKP